MRVRSLFVWSTALLTRVSSFRVLTDEERAASPYTKMQQQRAGITPAH
jgi:hypothetical protein